MKMPTKMYSYFLVIVSVLFNHITLKAIIISPEDIALQTVWESRTASRWQKFKVFLHDVKIKFPFSDAKNLRKAYLDFLPTCSRSGITQKERVICRVINNQNYFGYGVIIGATAFFSFLNALATIKARKARDRQYDYPKRSYVPPMEIKVPESLRAKMSYLDQDRDMFNPFEILNINEESTKEDVTKAYKKLSVRYHPDKHQGDEKEIYDEIFKIIGQARESADWIIDFIGTGDIPSTQQQPLLSIRAK